MKLYTSSGSWIDVANPLNNKPEDFCIEDMAKVARLARYGGMTNVFYSVGAHSLIMEYVLLNMTAELSGNYVTEYIKLLAKIALIHDLTEVYYSDVPQPVKILLPEYEKLEKDAFSVICKKFNVPEEYSSTNLIKPLDKYMWDLERPVLQMNRDFDVIYKDWIIGLSKVLNDMQIRLFIQNDKIFEHKSFIKGYLTGGTDMIARVQLEMKDKLLKYS